MIRKLKRYGIDSMGLLLIFLFLFLVLGMSFNGCKKEDKPTSVTIHPSPIAETTPTPTPTLETPTETPEATEETKEEEKDATNTYIEQKEHYTIVIDPAYGGELTGYVGALTEAEVNYAMAEAIVKRFEEDKRFTIVLTRANGESKAEKEKATKINEDKPDLCISLYTAHERSGKGSGMQIYPKKIGDPLNEESLAIANHVQKAFQKDNWQPNVFYRQYVPVENNLFQIQNIKVEDAKELTQSTWNILEDTTVNTIAVEQFYLSNEADIAMWANEVGYKEIADRYYQAICNYFQMK